MVDPSGHAGPTYQTLSQTWTEQQMTAFNVQFARLNNFEAAIRAVAAAYVNSGSFDTGAIVTHNGEVWQALVDDAEATEPSEAEAATWKRLGIEV